MAYKDCEEFYKWIVLLATKVYSNLCSYIAETELFMGIFFNRIPYLWNNLADDEVNYSVSSFRKLCSNFHKNKTLDSKISSCPLDFNFYSGSYLFS